MPETVITIAASPHSVEISRNASGGASFSVKVYAESPEQAMEKAKEIYGQLDGEFPAVRK